MFASKDVARKQSLGGTALQNSRDMQMTRYRRCRDTIGSEYKGNVHENLVFVNIFKFDNSQIQGSP